MSIKALFLRKILEVIPIFSNSIVSFITHKSLMVMMLMINPTMGKILIL